MIFIRWKPKLRNYLQKRWCIEFFKILFNGEAWVLPFWWRFRNDCLLPNNRYKKSYSWVLWKSSIWWFLRAFRQWLFCKSWCIRRFNWKTKRMDIVFCWGFIKLQIRYWLFCRFFWLELWFWSLLSIWILVNWIHWNGKWPIWIRYSSEKYAVLSEFNPEINIYRNHTKHYTPRTYLNKIGTRGVVLFIDS